MQHDPGDTRDCERAECFLGEIITLREVLLATSLLSAAIPVLCAKERILLYRVGPAQSTLFIANADGSDERPLLPNSSSDYNASFSPDGTGLKRLTTAPGNDAHAVWSPDGKHILFSSARLGFKDEGALYDNIPQPYGELFVMNGWLRSTAVDR